MKSRIDHLTNLQQRIIAGVLGAAIMIGGIVYNEWTFFLLFSIISYLALQEFYHLVRSAGIQPDVFFGALVGTLLFTFLFFKEKQLLDSRWIYLLFPVIFLLFLIELFRKSDKPFFNIAFTFLGNIYISFSFALMNVAAFQEGRYRFQIILGVLFLLWANDIGGYFVGRFLGKTKLFLRISPKKTWEGSVGGGLFSLLTALILSVYFTELGLIQWLGLSVIIVIIGSYGDLVESLLKRSLDIKDSGQMIPGHGGFLDRFDGLLLAAPFIAAFLRLFPDL